MPNGPNGPNASAKKSKEICCENLEITKLDLNSPWFCLKVGEITGFFQWVALCSCEQILGTGWMDEASWYLPQTQHPTWKTWPELSWTNLNSSFIHRPDCHLTATNYPSNTEIEFPPRPGVRLLFLNHFLSALIRWAWTWEHQMPALELHSERKRWIFDDLCNWSYQN